jgi:hypothetical protein
MLEPPAQTRMAEIAPVRQAQGKLVTQRKRCGLLERSSAGLKSSSPLLPFVPQGKKQGAPTKRSDCARHPKILQS